MSKSTFVRNRDEQLAEIDDEIDDLQYQLDVALAKRERLVNSEEYPSVPELVARYGAPRNWPERPR